MTACWYLVKRNWPQTAAKQPDYAGVGGDVWPLDGVPDAEARRVHDGLMASRAHVEVGQCTERLCLQRHMAEAYHAEAERRGAGVWLLELTAGNDVDDIVVGFDLGFPAGGTSLVESELITQGRAGPPLNRWGLINSRAEAVAYMTERAEHEELEEAAGIEVLAVRVLRHG